MCTNKFETLSYNENEEVNGGGAIVVGLCILGGIVLNEASERFTGKDIAEHVGDTIENVGRTLQDVAQSLFN